MRALLSFFWITLGEMIQKMSPLFKFENIALFINIWTADYKYSVPDS